MLDDRFGYNYTHLAPWRKVLRHDQISSLHRAYGIHPLERKNPIWRLTADSPDIENGEMDFTDGRDPTPFPGRCLEKQDRGTTEWYRHTLPEGHWLPTQNPYGRPSTQEGIRNEHVYWVSSANGTVLWDLGHDSDGNEIVPAPTPAHCTGSSFSSQESCTTAGSWIAGGQWISQSSRRRLLSTGRRLTEGDFNAVKASLTCGAGEAKFLIKDSHGVSGASHNERATWRILGEDTNLNSGQSYVDNPNWFTATDVITCNEALGGGTCASDGTGDNNIDDFGAGAAGKWICLKENTQYYLTGFDHYGSGWRQFSSATVATFVEIYKEDDLTTPLIRLDGGLISGDATDFGGNNNKYRRYRAFSTSWSGNGGGEFNRVQASLTCGEGETKIRITDTFVNDANSPNTAGSNAAWKIVGPNSNINDAVGQAAFPYYYNADSIVTCNSQFGADTASGSGNSECETASGDMSASATIGTGDYLNARGAGGHGTNDGVWVCLTIGVSFRLLGRDETAGGWAGQVTVFDIDGNALATLNSGNWPSDQSYSFSGSNALVFIPPTPVDCVGSFGTCTHYAEETSSGYGYTSIAYSITTAVSMGGQACPWVAGQEAACPLLTSTNTYVFIQSASGDTGSPAPCVVSSDVVIGPQITIGSEINKGQKLCDDDPDCNGFEACGSGAAMYIRKCSYIGSGSVSDMWQDNFVAAPSPSCWGLQKVSGSIENNIATNAAAISANTGDISTNTANVATNAAAIATNTDNVATNTNNVAVNGVDIGQNAADIATNGATGAANAADIVQLNDFKCHFMDGTVNADAWSNISPQNCMAGRCNSATGSNILGGRETGLTECQASTFTWIPEGDGYVRPLWESEAPPCANEAPLSVYISACLKIVTVAVQFQAILQIHGIGMPITMVFQKHAKVAKVVKNGTMDVEVMAMSGISVNLVYVEIIQRNVKPLFGLFLHPKAVIHQCEHRILILLETWVKNVLFNCNKLIKIIKSRDLKKLQLLQQVL
jgi:hypothetical protein